MSVSELTSLQKTLNAAIDVFKAELAAQNLPEPSLNTSKPHPIDDPEYVLNPAMYEARRVALASLSRIKFLMQSPHEALAASTWMALEPAGVRTTAEIGLADVLGESDDGLSLEEIAQKTGVDELKLERILRLLMTQGWFREPRPRYFANNRQSLLIQKSKPGYVLATFMNAFINRIAFRLPDMINHPDLEFRRKTDPFHTTFQLAYDTELSYFGADGWLTRHPEDVVNFGLAMGAAGVISDPGVSADFPWEALSKGKDGVVDVGGGQGTLCCSLARRLPGIKTFIVQDLPETRPAAEAFIASQGLSDRVKFEAQDFFQPQQRKGKYIYIMQRVLHIWNTEQGAQIIRKIRDVMNEDSCLLIIDTIILPGTLPAEGQDAFQSLKSLDNKLYQSIPPPEFIPADFGEAARNQHHINVALTALCNSFERTFPEMKSMVELGGMKIKSVHPTRSWMCITEVVPA